MLVVNTMEKNLMTVDTVYCYEDGRKTCLRATVNPCTCSCLDICRMYNKFISSIICRVSQRRLGLRFVVLLWNYIFCELLEDRRILMFASFANGATCWFRAHEWVLIKRWSALYCGKIIASMWAAKYLKYVLKAFDKLLSSLASLFDALYNPSFGNWLRTRNSVLSEETTSACWNKVHWRIFFRFTSIAMAEPTDTNVPELPVRLEVWTSRDSSIFPAWSLASAPDSSASNGRVSLICSSRSAEKTRIEISTLKWTT